MQPRPCSPMPVAPAQTRLLHGECRIHVDVQVIVIVDVGVDGDGDGDVKVDGDVDWPSTVVVAAISWSLRPERTRR